MDISGVSNQATIAYSNLKAGTEADMLKKTLEKQDQAQAQKLQSRQETDNRQLELQQQRAAEEAALTGKGQKINIKV